QVGAPVTKARVDFGRRGAQATTEAVPGHGIRGPRHRVRDPRWGVVFGDESNLDRAANVSFRPGQGPQRRTIPDGSERAERRVRPRWRRALSTARPPRVRMRARKP